MPTLPSIEVTTPQLGLVTEVWGAMDPTLTPTQNYQRWLRRQIISEVIRARRAQVDALYAAEVQKLDAQRDEMINSVVTQLQDPADPYKASPTVAPKAPTA